VDKNSRREIEMATKSQKINIARRAIIS